MLLTTDHLSPPAARPLAHNREDDLLAHLSRAALCPGPERARASRDAQTARQRPPTRDHITGKLCPRPRGLFSPVSLHRSGGCVCGAATRVGLLSRVAIATRRTHRPQRGRESHVRCLHPERIQQAVHGGAPDRVFKVRLNYGCVLIDRVERTPTRDPVCF